MLTKDNHQELALINGKPHTNNILLNANTATLLYTCISPNIHFSVYVFALCYDISDAMTTIER